MSEDARSSPSQARRRRNRMRVLTSPAKDTLDVASVPQPLTTSSSALHIIDNNDRAVTRQLQRRTEECVVLRNALCAVHARLLDLQHEQHLRDDLDAFLRPSTSDAATQTERNTNMEARSDDETVSEVVKESEGLATALLDCVAALQQQQHEEEEKDSACHDKTESAALRDAAEQLRHALQQSHEGVQSDGQNRQLVPLLLRRRMQDMRALARCMAAAIPPSCAAPSHATPMETAERTIETMMREAASLAAQRTAELQSSARVQASREAACRALQRRLRDCEEALQREQRTGSALRARVAALEAQLPTTQPEASRDACNVGHDSSSMLIAVDPSRRLFEGSATAPPSHANSVSVNTRSAYDKPDIQASPHNTTTTSTTAVVNVSDIPAAPTEKYSASELGGSTRRGRSSGSSVTQSERRNRRVPAPPLIVATDTM